MKNKLSKSHLSFLGLSHLGTITSLCTASLGFKVSGIDPDPKIINSLKRQTINLDEPGLDQLLKRSKKNIEFSNNFSKIQQSDIVVFAQDTATDNSGSVQKLDSLIDKSMPFLKKNVTIIVMSQVPIGYCRHLKEKIQKIKPEINASLYHWVDTIVMTNAIDRFLNPQQIIIGCESKSLKIPEILKKYLSFFKCLIFFISYESAELTKAAVNLYLANSITYANTLADFCEATGANINEITPALKSDNRIGQYSYIKPGLRIAGGHLERDLLMLGKIAKRKQISSGVVRNILRSNQKRYRWVLKKISSLKLEKVKDSKICIWGLSYKKNTSSINNAASLKIIPHLVGKYKLSAYDPLAVLPTKIKGIAQFSDKYQALKGSDCLIILTDWDEFKRVNFKRLNFLMDRVNIIDCVSILDESFPKNKINYISLGVG